MPKEAAPIHGDAILTLLDPDVCVTDGVNVPYESVGYFSDHHVYSPDVRYGGLFATNANSCIAVTYNTEPGSAGVKSGVVQGHARPVADMSSTVNVSGAPLVRDVTQYEMNCAGCDGPFNCLATVSYSGAGGAASSSAIDADGDIETDDGDKLPPDNKPRRRRRGPRSTAKDPLGDLYESAQDAKVATRGFALWSAAGNGAKLLGSIVGSFVNPAVGLGGVALFGDQFIADIGTALTGDAFPTQLYGYVAELTGSTQLADLANAAVGTNPVKLAKEAKELGTLYKDIDAAKSAGDTKKFGELVDKLEGKLKGYLKDETKDAAKDSAKELGQKLEEQDEEKGDSKGGASPGDGATVT